DVAALQQRSAHAHARLVESDAPFVRPGVDPDLELALRTLAVTEVPGERAGHGGGDGDEARIAERVGESRDLGVPRLRFFDASDAAWGAGGGRGPVHAAPPA